MSVMKGLFRSRESCGCRRNSSETMTECAPMPVHGLVTASQLVLPGARSWPLHGSLPPGPRLAVVGSRAAQRVTLACIPAIVAAAGARGYALVSGGARGIDAAVHHAALAAGIAQLAIVPCTPDDPYPPEHAALFSAIAAAPGSGVLYARPAGVARARGTFASRNALVVASAAALVVAQAQQRSGSWGTGRLALRGALATAAILGSSGCAELITLGAHALPCEPNKIEAAVLAWLDTRGYPAVAPSWPTELRWLADALESAGPRGLCLDDLLEVGPASANAALLSAELLGLVIESPPGRYHPQRS